MIRKHDYSPEGRNGGEKIGALTTFNFSLLRKVFLTTSNFQEGKLQSIIRINLAATTQLSPKSGMSSRPDQAPQIVISPGTVKQKLLHSNYVFQQMYNHEICICCF